MTRKTELNKLVANLTVLYTKLHSFHWYVTGRSFYTLHEVFENYYNYTTESLDEVAERLLAIGGRPVSTLKGALEIVEYSCYHFRSCFFFSCLLNCCDF